MNLNKHVSEIESNSAVTTRKVYRPPTLEMLGSVSDLVMAGNSASNEGQPSPGGNMGM